MAYLAHYDIKASPSLVLGWYDTDAQYSVLPSPMLHMTDMEWDNRFVGTWKVEGGRLMQHVHKLPELPHGIAQGTIITRLSSVGALRAFRILLKAELPDASLSDDELLLRERWAVSAYVRSDDAQMRALFTAAGADPDKVLATVAT